MNKIRWIGLLLALLLLGATACSTAPRRTSEIPVPNAKAVPVSTPVGTGGLGVAAEKSVDVAIICEHEKDKRTLMITRSPKGCMLRYYKFGKFNILASSDKSATHCEHVQSKVKQNLEASHFTCK